MLCGLHRLLHGLNQWAHGTESVAAWTESVGQGGDPGPSGTDTLRVTGLDEYPGPSGLTQLVSHLPGRLPGCPDSWHAWPTPPGALPAAPRVILEGAFAWW